MKKELKNSKDLTHVVSFSGGRTSAYLVERMNHRAKKYGIKVKYVFMDTGAEDPKTYEFIKNIVKHWKIDLVCLRVMVNPKLGEANYYREISLDELKCDLQPWRDILKKYGTPYFGGAFCTRAMKGMKTKKNGEGVFYQYCNEKFGKGNYVSWLGIRIDEPKRLKPKPELNYLADISDFEKQDILSWWKKQPFDLEIPEWLGNCIFCVKKGTNKIALAARERPAQFEEFSSMLEESSVRDTECKFGNLIMYRGRQSLRQIVDSYKDVPTEEIKIRMRKEIKNESNTCAEACEPLSFESSDCSDLDSEVSNEKFNKAVRNIPKKSKGERNKNDWYPTSYALAERLMESVDLRDNDVLLDPCKGMKENEPFYSAMPTTHKRLWAEIGEGVDYFKSKFSADVIISNPPYNIAEDFIKKGVDDLNAGGMMILLLRINYLGSQKRHKSLWSNEKYIPKALITLAERPSFTGDGKTDMTEYAFYVFGDTSRLKDQSPFQWLSWR